MTKPPGAKYPPALLLALAAVAGAAALPILMQVNESADLLALWLAAEALTEGLPLYPDATGPFTMRPPEGWAELAARGGYEGPVFPYLYPPIWAELLARTGASFATLKVIAGILNPLLFLAISWLSWRAIRPRMGLAPFLLIGQILLYGTLVGVIALHSDQPQILVAFLLVLAVERDANGAPFAAGAALATAAAIKLFPALFVIVWLATGNRRALLGFVTFGGALGLASLALAGWPAHAHLLQLASQISHSMMSIPLSVGLDASLLELLHPEDAQLVSGVVTANSPHAAPVTFVLTKPDPILWLGRIAYVAVLGAAAIVARRQGPRDRARVLWPVLLAAIPMIGPLAWAYYFIPLYAAAPWLLERHGTRAGVLLLVAAAAPLSLPMFQLLYAVTVPFQVIGAAAVIVLMAAFAVPGRATAAQPEGQPDGQPLHPRRSSL